MALSCSFSSWKFSRLAHPAKGVPIGMRTAGGRPDLPRMTSEARRTDQRVASEQLASLLAPSIEHPPGDPMQFPLAVRLRLPVPRLDRPQPIQGGPVLGPLLRRQFPRASIARTRSGLASGEGWHHVRSELRAAWSSSTSSTACGVEASPKTSRPRISL